MSWKDKVVERLRRSTNPDPKAVARKVIPTLDPDEIREVLVFAVEQYARESERFFRTNIRNGSFAKSERWQTAAEQYSIFSQRVYIAGEWRFFGDCSVNDLELLADEYRTSAKQRELIGDSYDRLADRLRRTGARQVKDLPEQDVLEALAI